MVLSTLVESWRRSPRIEGDLVLKNLVCSWFITYLASREKNKLFLEACKAKVVSLSKDRSGSDLEVLGGVEILTLHLA